MKPRIAVLVFAAVISLMLAGTLMALFRPGPEADVSAQPAAGAAAPDHRQAAAAGSALAAGAFRRAEESGHSGEPLLTFARMKHAGVAVSV